MSPSSWFRYMSLIAYVCFLATAVAQAQDYLLQPGMPPFSTNEPVELGYINLANGNLHLEIPLVSVSQRDASTFTASLVYDSRIWSVACSYNTWLPYNVNGCLNTSWTGWRFMTSGDTGSRGGFSSKATACGSPYGGSRTAYNNFAWSFPDGSTKNFPSVSTLYVDTNCAKDGYKAITTSGGYASDASGYFMVVTNYYSPVVYAPDGTQVGADPCCYLNNPIDSNGNYISSNSFQDQTKIDTLDRKPLIVTTNCNGNSNQTCYDVTNSQGGTSRYIVTTTSISASTAFGWSSYREYSGSTTVVQSISLPDQTTYQFTYDSGTTPGHYGELTSVTLPTGGQIGYGYTNFADARGAAYVNRWITSRTSGSGTWTYTPQVITQGTTQQVTLTRPNGDNVVYTYNVAGSSIGNTQIQAYNGAVSPANLAATAVTIWNSGNTQKTSETITLPVPGGGSVSQTKQFIYDSVSDQNVSQLSEWKYYTGSLPTTADRVTSATYTLANSTYAAAHIIDKLTSVTIKSGSGTQLAQTNYSYDSTSVLSVTGIFHHDDVNFGTGNTTRGNLTQVQRWTGGSSYLATTMTYDTTGQLRSIQDPALNTTSLSYSDNFFTDSSGTVIPPTFTAPAPTNAYLTQVTLPTSGSLTYGYYYGSGKRAMSKDQNAADTYAHYLDALDRPTLSYGALLPSSKRPWSLTTYSASDTQIDTYVAIGDATPATGCSSCTHNQAVLDGLGRTITKELVNDPDGPTFVNTAYDSSGRVQSTSHPYRSTSDSTYGLETPTYDVLGRVIKMTHQDGTYSQSFYGAAVAGTGLGGVTAQLCPSATYGVGYPVLTIDEAGKKRETWRDGFGNLVEVDEPDSNGNLTSATCYQYDLLGNLLTIVHGNQTRSYAYDSLSRLTSETIPEQAVGGPGTSYLYYSTSGGALCSGDPREICRRTDPRGITTSYTYDSLYRLTGKSYSDSTPAVTYSTDQTNCGTGNLSNGAGRTTGVAVADGSSSTLWCYDAMGHLITDKRTIAGVAKTISYTFNSDDSLSSIVYPSGRSLTYNIGNAGRAVSAIDSAGVQYVLAPSLAGQSGSTYVPPGAVASLVYGKVSGGFAGITETRAYNNRLELTSIQASSVNGNALGLGLCNTSFSFSTGCSTSSANNNANLTGIANNVDSGRSLTYINPDNSTYYDPLIRVQSVKTQATSGADCWGQTFGYDDRGNLLSVSPSQCGSFSLSVGVDANNHIITGGYVYDGAGNMTQDGSGFSYSYDAENRLKTASGMSGGPYTYTYDGGSLRVEKSNGVAGTLYWRGLSGDTVTESDLSGNITSEYIFFGGRQVARRDASGNLFFYNADSLDTTRTITDANGNVCYDAEFTPYGTELIHTNNCPQNYKFTGYERDAETGLDYALARYYNSRTGRFMSVDPMEGDINNPQSFNRYSYVDDNPVNLVDPSGLWSQSYLLGPSNPHWPKGFQCFIDGVPSGCGMAFGLLFSGSAELVAGNWWAATGIDTESGWIHMPSGLLDLALGDKLSFGKTCGSNPDKLNSLAGDVRYKNPANAKIAFQPETAAALSSAIREMNAKGIVPTISGLGGYRTAADQVQAQQESGTNPHAAVGKSWHQDGRAVDFRGIGTSPQGPTIKKIMAANGFSRITGDVPHFQNALPGTSPNPTSIAEAAAYYAVCMPGTSN